MTLAQLHELDFQSWHGDDPSRGVLTFEALLGLVADTGTRLFVETKHPVRYRGLVETKLIAELERHGLTRPPSKDESRVVVMSFSELAVRRVRREVPLVPTVFLIGSVASAQSIRVGDYAGPGIGRLREDPDYVSKCAEYGRATYCWTVDQPEDIWLCQRLGVRFIATNKPADTRKVLHGSVPATEPTR
jgi:glycerophosphoryl diester phosphodiesterase